MEEVCGLLFEISSKKRLRILIEAQKQSLRISHVSKMLNITTAEASRHLNRLSNVKLVRRDNKGLYTLTPFGRLVLILLPSLVFILQHRDYFMNHEVFHIPYKFLGRIGVVSGGVLCDNAMTCFSRIEVMLHEASEYIWILSDQIPASMLQTIMEKIRKGLEFRFIYPEKFTLLSSKPIPCFQRRTLPKITLGLIITEKRALVAFPYIDGKMDYIGFIGGDPEFHKWAEELYQYYWKSSKPEKSCFNRHKADQ